MDGARTYNSRMASFRGCDWLIDGYNLLPRWRARVGGGGAGKLAAERDALLAWLAARLPEPGRATVAFDARDDSRAGVPRGAAQWSSFRGVKVAFATGYRDADALLAELCTQHPAPRSLRIVSDDHAVRDVARRAGGGWVSCPQFLATLDHGEAEPAAPRDHGPRTSTPTAADDRLRPASAAETAEWLRAFGGTPAPEPLLPPRPPPAIPAAKREARDCNDGALDDFLREMRAAEAQGFAGDVAPLPRKPRRRPPGV